MEKKALTPEAAAETYSISRGTLANMRSRGEGPKYFKRGRRICYFAADFEKWLRSEPHLTTDSERA